MRTICVAAILAALIVPATAADLMPSAIRALLEKGDAASVVQSIDEPSWTAFLSHVEAGDRGWIDLVPLVAPGTDEAASQGLTKALSRALTANPEAVLGVLAADHDRFVDICADHERGASSMEIARFIDLALVKVAAVLDPSLSKARDACLHQLSDARMSALI